MRSTIAVLCGFLLLASDAVSQIIPVKTIPLARGDQFLIYPSENRAIGGVTVALDDTLADPFRNPAAGVLTKGIRAFASPLFYGVGLQSGQAGTAGRTFPVGMLLGNEQYFGGLTWARQTLTTAKISFPIALTIPGTGESDEFNSNTYTFGIVGMKIPGTTFSVGISAFWADLSSVDGVQYLYPNVSDLTQRGSVSTYRLGVRGSFEGDRVFEAILAHQVTDMRHTMRTFWIPGPPVPWDSRLTIPQSIRTEQDKTLAYGFHLGYHQPLNDVLRIGGIFSGTIKSHPKIPNYELMNIPRDPGNSTAWNFGVGLTSRGQKAQFAVDLVYEPIASETWSEAETGTGGLMISPGDRTIENFFDFSNYHLRFGVRSLVHDLGMGLHFYKVSYHLKQINHIGGTIRRQSESWTETTLSIGFGFDVLGGRVKYLGLADFGTGRPGVIAGWTNRTAFDAAMDFLVPPSGSIVLDDAVTISHQISFIVEFN